MSPRCVVLLFSLFLATCAAVQEEDGGAESAQACHGYCSDTYPEHTYPNVRARGKLGLLNIIPDNYCSV